MSDLPEVATASQEVIELQGASVEPPGQNGAPVGASGQPGPVQPHHQEQTRHHEIRNWLDESRNRPYRTAGIIIFGVLLLLLATIITLAVLLGKAKSRETPTSNPTFAAIKYSGLAAHDIERTTNGSRIIQLFYQNRLGDIISLLHNSLGWHIATEVVATDARKGTSITALPYREGDGMVWRVMYIDKHDILQEKHNTNLTNGWQRGPLGDKGLRAARSSTVGVAACYHPKWYGDREGGGIRLYYGAASGYIREAEYTVGSKTWEEKQNFLDTNAHGGVDCTVRNLSVTSVWLHGKDGELQLWWYEFNVSAADNSSHPAEKWVKGLTISDIHPNSSISGSTQDDTTRLIYWQRNDGKIIEGTIQGAANTSSLDKEAPVNPEVESPMDLLSGSKIASTIIGTDRGSYEIHVYRQAPDGRIFESIRTLLGSTWGSALPLPLRAVLKVRALWFSAVKLR